MRRYRRSDHMAPPKLVVSEDRAYNRPVTLPSLVVCEAAVVILAQTLQVLVLLLPHTI
jgi:hypothetical protein